MSEQDGTQVSTKRPRSRRTKQDGTQAEIQQRPANDDNVAWKAYWKQQGQLWRTEPEIDTERQAYLARQLLIIPNIGQGIYPFKDIKLSRADVEWLLAAHEGRLQVDWSSGGKQEREGLDLRGADLSQVDLSNLPLAHVHAGLTVEEWLDATAEQRNAAAVFMDRASLNNAHLEKASFGFAHLKEVDFRGAHLEDAHLRYAHLEKADFCFVHLENAHLRGAYLARANFRDAHLEGIRLEDANLSDEKLVGPRLVDAHWGDANLATVNWSQVRMLGDEYEARQKRQDEKLKDERTRRGEYQNALRANRQLAVALQAQGLNEDAARFNYRAQNLQKSFLWFQTTQHDVRFRQRLKMLGTWLFSCFLFLLAGYGYRLWRSFATYVLVIIGFATAYYLLGATTKFSLSPLDAIIFSVTSFHGRGFPQERISD